MGDTAAHKTKQLSTGIQSSGVRPAGTHHTPSLTSTLLPDNLLHSFHESKPLGASGISYKEGFLFRMIDYFTEVSSVPSSLYPIQLGMGTARTLRTASRAAG